MPRCVTHGPSSPKPSERSQRHCLWSEGRATRILRAQRLASGLMFQSIYKKIFTYSLMLSLNAHTREDALFLFQTVYVQCPDGSCTALNTPVAVEEVKQIDLLV